jgi:cell wall-associated NlpC family hydrolase
MCWVMDHLGKPWVAGARGPNAFDCWGWLVWCYRQHHGIDLPVWAGVDPKDKRRVSGIMLDSTASGSDWIATTAPVDFCAVAMSQSKIIHHVGLYLAIDRGVVVHACDGKGLIAQPVHQLPASGWRTIQFYRHRALS